MAGLSLRLGLGLAIPRGASGPAGPVNLLDNGDFEAAAPPPTLVQGGGTASVAISGGTLNFASGSSAASTYAEWDIPSLVSGNSYDLAFDYRFPGAIGSFYITLGDVSGSNPDHYVLTGHPGDNNWRSASVTLIVGAVDQKVRIYTTQSFANRGFSADNISLVAA